MPAVSAHRRDAQGKQLALLPARERDARVCVCVCGGGGGGGQCARVARSTDNDGAQQYSAHASNHVTVRTNSYSGARAHNNTCQKTTSAGASRRTAGCSKTHHLSRGRPEAACKPAATCMHNSGPHYLTNSILGPARAVPVPACAKSRGQGWALPQRAHGLLVRCAHPRRPRAPPRQRAHQFR